MTSHTLYAHWIILDSIENVSDFLALNSGGATVDNPINLPVFINLGNTAEAGSGWRNLLTAIDNAGKFVSLDLSACTMSGTTFYFDINFGTGKDKVVSLVLPDSATATSGSMGHYTNLANSFTVIEFLRGVNIINIGGALFWYWYENNNTLKEVDFPEATTIGGCAFGSCIALQTVNIPKLKIIGSSAFADTALESVNFPEATSIGSDSFRYCTSLE